MFNAYHFVDAVPATMAGMVALWAGGSARHWFVRTSVVVAGLLALLLIPAYEMVIAFGAEILVVVVGLKVWRSRRTRREGPGNEHTNSRKWPQVSLQTLMLLTAVVAVTVAVAVSFPALDWFQWMSQTGSGLVAGSIILLCAWFVLGKASRTIRVAAAFMLWTAIAVGISLLEITGYAAYYWLYYSTDIAAYLLQPESREWVWTRSLYWLSTLAIAMPIVCAWLCLVVQANWLPRLTDDNERLPEMPTSRRSVMARWALVTLSLAVMAFPLYLMYRLLTPAPYPEVTNLMPLGYDELVAAGELIDVASKARLERHDQLSDDALADEIATHELALSRMRQAFSHPPTSTERTVAVDEPGATNLIWVVSARLDLANRLKLPEEQVEASLDWLRLFDFFARDSEPVSAVLYLSFQDRAVQTLWECRQQLPADQPRELVGMLSTLERRAVPWKKVAELQRIMDENSGWSMHLAAMLDDWTGNDRHSQEKYEYGLPMTKLRVLICDLAIREFRHDQRRLPNGIDELVPDYLPAVLIDPFSEAPLTYCVTGDSFTLYSVGPDGHDDGDTAFDSATLKGDLTTADLFPLPQSGQTGSAGVPQGGGGEAAGDSESADQLNENKVNEQK